MTPIALHCSNPDCNTPLAFDATLAGTVQPCPHCGTENRLPVTVRQRNHDTPPREIPTGALPLMEKQKNDYRSRTQKKVKAGAGCMAMFGTVVGILVVATGLSIAGFVSWESVGGIIALAGLAGVAAFAYFGYFAVEADDDLYDGHRRNQGYR